MRDKSRLKIITAAISVIVSILALVVTIFAGAQLKYISLGPISFDTPTPTFVIFNTSTPSFTPIRTMTPRSTSTPTPTPTSTLTPTPTPISQDLSAQVAALRSEVAALREEVDSLTQAVASNPDSNELRTDLQSVDERLSVIEQVVLDNPARALQLTLLSQEMDNLKARYQSDLESTRQEIARIYDLNKWFIGLMFTMAIGLLSLAVSNFVKTPEKREERREQQEQPKKTQSVSTRK